MPVFTPEKARTSNYIYPIRTDENSLKNVSANTLILLSDVYLYAQKAGKLNVTTPAIEVVLRTYSERPLPAKDCVLLTKEVLL